MTFRNLYILILFLLFFVTSQAQQTAIYTSDLVVYQKALALYNNKQYQAAQSLFQDIKQDAPNETIASECAYYIANCAVRLNQRNADDLVQDFVQDYPTSTKRNSAYFDVANYYFSNGKYAYARKWYDQVDESSISRAERDAFNFKYGYTLYSTDDQARATTYFNRVITSQEYGSQAKYYIGFMAYEGDDYDKANTYFDQVSDEDTYREKLSYYQADLNFKLGKFEKAIALAKEQIAKGSPQEKSELSKIIGESYFNLEQYAEATPYLKAYTGKRGKWTNVDYYQLGYGYYKQNDFEKAISEFNKIIDGNNAVAQNAYYHLGESYINLDKKQEALNAFRNASQMDYYLKIQEDAWLNYAKISYDIGNPYQSVPQVLTSYLERYPQSAFKNDIESLLIDSYITSKNYKDAITLLEGKNSFENRVAYQKVAFYRGVEIYNEAGYSEAKTLFNASIREAKDDVFTARATFWKAETDYLLNNFDDALIGFKQFAQQSKTADLKENDNLNYHIGYTYFKLKNYSQATASFQKFIDNHKDDQLRLNDAYLRLGDGYFVSSNYENAIDAYEKASDINAIEGDYAAFQKAVSYGYIGQGAKKLQALDGFINDYPKSALRDDAMYELANSYVKINDTDKAMLLYNQLVSEYNTSVFIPKALLRQGLSYYNKNDNERALTKFKQVAKEFPATDEASQAVSTARLIYIDLGRVDEYAAWVKTLDYINVTGVELDNTSYLAAEKQYLENNVDNAIKQFNSYLNKFPNGIHALKSHFYLAELYSKKSLPENAQPHYEYVVNQQKGEFTEQSIVKLSERYLNTANWEKAIPLLKRLEKEADYPQNITYAQSDLMNAYYQEENYSEAVIYAEKVLQDSKIDTKVKSDAQIIIARSAFRTGDMVKAKSAYAQVEKIATGALAAEALYYNAYFKFQEAKYEASNTTVQKLARDYSSYKMFSAKGLVIMAKNYDALGDAFQATYILESVITNFPEFDGLISEAKAELEHIKSKAAETNASVETDKN
ncbi:MAG: tetratricopeptide repeat protein [Psychroserpens sp.]|uniref:tetratricopeptide repeat protein n=1 Tax=Psychroserpens sp. TaxID=2020870 RepID=UPI003CB2588A